MLSRALVAWRAARCKSVAEIQAGCRRTISGPSPASSTSSASASGPGRPTNPATETVRDLPGASSSGRLLEGIQAEASEGAAFAGPEEPSAIGRVFSIVGNTLLAGILGGGAFIGYYQLRYDCKQVEELVQQTREHSTSSVTQLWADVLELYATKRAQLEAEVKKYSDPPSDRLLPDLPPQVRHVRTLVLDLDDTLVHSDWTRGRGWRTFKRPGTDDFLQQLAHHFELVVYTSQLPTYADPILDRLDPHRFIQFRLYRDSTRYINGKHVRDLSHLNRDLNKVLLITTDANAAALQPDNAIQVKPWKLEAEDTVLLDLLPFLEAVWATNVPDVRDIVRSYKGQDIATAFRERMRLLQEANKQQKQVRKSFLGNFSR